IAGQAALVTGGARGLGAATARSLSGAGARVFVLDRRQPDAAERFDERISFLAGDVTDLDSMTRAVDTIAQETGGLDIVDANAAGAPGSSAREGGPASREFAVSSPPRWTPSCRATRPCRTSSDASTHARARIS